jgi:hypothetical protein
MTGRFGNKFNFIGNQEGDPATPGCEDHHLRKSASVNGNFEGGLRGKGRNAFSERRACRLTYR